MHLFSENKQIKNEFTSIAVLAIDIVSYSIEFDEIQFKMVNILYSIIEDIIQLIKGKNDIIILPTGDGAIITFVKGTSEHCIQVAIDLHEKIKADLLRLPIRIGIHEGSGIIYQDINGKQNLVGNVINMCQRVMDLGDKDHILISDTSYSALKNREKYVRFLEPLENNPVQVKHGVAINVYNYFDGKFGSLNPPSKFKAVSFIYVRTIHNIVESLTLSITGADGGCTPDIT